MLDFARPGTPRRDVVRGGGGRAMLVELRVMEQRYHAVMEVVSGAPVGFLVADQRWADLVNAEFEGGYPTAQAAAALRDEIRFQRGVQLYDWALPAVALEAMRRACEAHFGGGCTTMVSWRRIGPEVLAVTSNPDCPHIAGDGPRPVWPGAGL